MPKRSMEFIGLCAFCLSAGLLVACGTDQSAPTAPALPEPPAARIAFHSDRDGNREIYVMQVDGTVPVRITNAAGTDQAPELSPNGRRIVFQSDRTGNAEIFVADADGNNAINLTNSTATDGWPRWSPNGTQIAFHSNRDGNFEIYLVNADGTGAPRRVTNSAVLDQFPAWSPDGKRIAFRRDMDIWVIDASGEEQNARQLTFQGTTVNQMPSWSPNGKQIAFMSARAGYPAVFVMDANGDTPDRPAVNLTPKDPADAASAWSSRAPTWSRSGTQILFMSLRPSTGGDSEIFVMNADGTSVMRLTFSTGEDGFPTVR
jgi:Tol biopolymer transport system component